MKTRLFIIASLSVLLAGCSKSERSEIGETATTNRLSRTTPLTGSAAQAPRHSSETVVNQVSPSVVANNTMGTVSSDTVTNAGASALTPKGDNAASESDVGIVQRIRKSFLTDESVAAIANKVSIVSSNGNVVLHGTVPTEIIKMSVGDRAKAIADVKSVDNQLKVQ